MSTIWANKRGYGLIESKALKLFVFLLVIVLLILFSRNILDSEKFNELRANSLALDVNSFFIPKGDFNLNYQIGDESREIVFEDNIVKTYIDDPIREGEGDIIIGEGYQIITRNFKTNTLVVSKKDNRVELG